METTRGDGYTISTDRRRLDLGAVHAFLRDESYWAPGIPRETVERAVANSLCFGIYAPGGEQAGFARVVTDRATFAYLCDVFVLRAHRGAHLGVWLVETVLAHPDLPGLRRWMLGTRDAHELYGRFGFQRILGDKRFMAIDRPAGELWGDCD